jgi:hypothetical protein
MTGDTGLIAAIYDAIIEPSGWDDVVERIVEATKSVSGALFIDMWDTAHLSALCNTDPFYADAYVQHYHRINPLTAAVAAIAPGEVWTATSISQSDSFKASAFCNEFVRPQGWAELVVVGLLRTPKTFGNLSLQRSPNAMWVEPAEWHLLETLAPHLRRAAAIQDLLSRTRATTESLGAAVAAAGFAAFLLTRDCRVLFANAKAEDLIQRGIGLRYERGRLAATSPALTARLHALARKGACHKTSEGDIGGTLELCGGENRPPLVAHVIPLAPIRTVAIFGLDQPAIAVFIVDPAANLDATAQRIAARYGLTGAETRVLVELVAATGVSPPPRGSASPRRRCVPTQAAFSRKLRPPARRNSSAGSSRPNFLVRRTPPDFPKIKIPLEPAINRSDDARARDMRYGKLWVSWRPKCVLSPASAVEEAMLHFSRWALIGCVLGMALVTFSTGANAVREKWGVRGAQNGIGLNGIAVNGIAQSGVPANARIIAGSGLGDLNGVAVEAVIIPESAAR